jgi:predicted TIM-barrel fold metal-dependent hydrolase
MSSPGTHLFPGDDQQARTLTREVNEYMSEVCTKYKQYFQFFASLPLPDVEGSLTEIDYAIDHLGAVGFQIMTNSHGIYPGDPRFRRVYDKLSERKTIVFFHPTSCNLRREKGSVEHVNPLAGVPSPLMEFMFDTTRAITSLLTSGTVTRCPGIKFLICHCGATFPPIAVRQDSSFHCSYNLVIDARVTGKKKVLIANKTFLKARIAEFSQFLIEDGEPMTLETVKNLLQTRFYIDLAGVPFPDQIHGLLRHVDTTRLLYGSDYPFTPAPLAKSLAKRLDDELKTDFGVETQKRILLTNAQDLLDRRHHAQSSKTIEKSTYVFS